MATVMEALRRLSSEEEQSVHSATYDHYVEKEEILVHAPTILPLPFGVEENQEDVIFVDPSGSEGKRILSDPTSSISELFALLRQPVSPVCDNVELIVGTMLERDIGPNDIDAITGMSVLHYAVRAESIASAKSAPVRVLKRLMSCGGDLSQRTLYTDMNALHLAAFFNASLSIELMIQSLEEEEVHCLLGSLCSEFCYGSALHIAAANLCFDAAQKLLKLGADKDLFDEMGRTAERCIPHGVHFEDDIKCLKRLKALFGASAKRGKYAPSQDNEIHVKNVVSSKTVPLDREVQAEKLMIGKFEFSVGARVIVAGAKQGVVRFMGLTDFSEGIWCGIELDDPVGRNDGSINGVRYFKCDKTRGIFAPPNKLTLIKKSDMGGEDLSGNNKHSSGTSKASGKCNVEGKDLKVGMVVYVDHLKEYGKIKYIGETDFASGIWVGLSLQKPLGKNDGTVQGREYFKCRPHHGTMVRPSRLSTRVQDYK